MLLSGMYILLLISFCQTLENPVLNLAILIPLDSLSGNCTMAAIQMALDDIEKQPDMIYRNLTRYNLSAQFMRTDEKEGNAIEAQYRLYQTSPIKIATIGPPYKEQNDYCIEYSTAQANLHISYSDANEPLEPYFIMYFQTPPSIVSNFIAASSFLRKYNWSRVAIVYDYADARYRNNADSLREILEAPGNFKIKVLTAQGVWSKPVSFSVSTQMGEIQNKGIRIILALISVSGARKIFCEAYNKRMIKPKVLWILFEILPNDWASEKYNAEYTTSGYKREINCSEEQLLDAAHGYVSLTKQSLRKDNKPTLSNVSSEMFLQRLHEKIASGYKCDENLAYAYDAIWVAAMSLKLADSKTDLSTYSYYSFEIALLLANSVKNVSFEGITGPLSYQELVSGGNPSRIGQISLHVFKKDVGMKLIGLHDTANDVLIFEPKAEQVLFQSNVVPRDQSNYNFYFSNFSNALLITVWFFAFLGIVIAALCCVFSFMFKPETSPKYSALPLNGAIITGSLLCYLSVIIYGIDTRFVSEDTIPEICNAFISSLSIGFTLTFGSLFSKVWRMYKIYMRPVNLSNKGLIFKHVPEWLMFVVIAGFLLVDIIILTTWSKISPFTIDIKNITTIENLFDDTINIEQLIKCTCNYQTEFTIGLYCYKGLLLLFGIFLVWQLKSACNKSESSSKNIGMAVYNAAAISVTGVICVSILATTNKFEASYIIITVCICICNTTTLLLIFLPKILLVINSNGLIIQNSDSMSNGEDRPVESFSAANCNSLHKKRSMVESISEEKGVRHEISFVTTYTQAESVINKSPLC